MNFFRFYEDSVLSPKIQKSILILSVLASVSFYVTDGWTSLQVHLDSTLLLMSIFAFCEETVFRGVLLDLLASHYKKITAILLSSVAFGLWQLKNFSTLSTSELMQEVLYAGLLLGPLLSWFALNTKNIWVSVSFNIANKIIFFPLIGLIAEVLSLDSSAL